MKKLMKTCLVVLMAGGILIAGQMARADDGREYRVTITNLTRGQIISPPVVVSHKERFHLFTAGTPASPELAKLAEDADTADLLLLLGSEPDVFDVQQAGGPVLPGGTVEVTIDARGKFRYISVAGMLVTTNDAFAAIDGERIPKNDARSTHAYAYDAGSETNSESCDEIPGPPCNNPFVRNTGGAEGYVHIHAGIHGTGNLDPAQHDWRNPVALISIERLD